MRSNARLVFVLCVIASAGTLASAANSQADKAHLRIQVDDHRPLAAAVLEVERRTGWIVTYEDPSYVHPSEIADVTAAVRKTPGPGRVLVPRRGAFAFDLPEGGEPRSTLTSMLAAYDLTGNDGEFHLEQTNNVFHVLPSTAKGGNGLRRTYTSLLTATISRPFGDAPAADALVGFVNSVKAAGRPIALGMIPALWLSRVTVHDGAKNEPAVTVLVRLLSQTGRPFSWQLLCQPGDDQLCYLNLHEVIKK